MHYEFYELTNRHPQHDPAWRWRQKGRNGEIVASGESYSSRSNVIRAIKRVRGLNVLWPIREVAE